MSPALAGGFFTISATREALYTLYMGKITIYKLYFNKVDFEKRK